MNTFLLAWNPKNWDWVDLANDIDQVNMRSQSATMWTCRNQKAREGDRFYLMKLGVAPKGIIGAGQIVKNPYLYDHYDKLKAKKREKSPRVDVLFGTLSATPIIHDNILKKELPGFHWYPQQSGVFMPDNIVKKLDALWLKKTGTKPQYSTSEETEKYREGEPKKVTITTYNRSRKARLECIKHHGFTCEICKYNFEQQFGEIGKGFIHVHHLKNIASYSKEYEIDPIKDLRPVCPNCHAMLHRTTPAANIKEVKLLLNNKSKI